MSLTFDGRMRGDLHVHTTFSDGSDSLLATLNKGIAVGLSHIAITDHDTTAALRLATALGRERGIVVIPGVEISAYHFPTDRKIHVLGYGVPSPAPAVEAICEPIRRRRGEMTLRQISILQEAGYPVSRDKVEATLLRLLPPIERRLRPRDLFKQHIMDVLITEGVADGFYGALYQQLFKGEGLCAEDITYADVFAAVEAIAKDGGVAVLAHPGQQRSLDLVPELVEAGLSGIELNHPDNSEADKRRIEGTARRHGLFLTGGSDAHGRLGSTHQIGDIQAPPRALERLIAARALTHC